MDLNMSIDVFAQLDLADGSATREAYRTYAQRCGVERLFAAPLPSRGEPDELDVNLTLLEHCAGDDRLLPVYTAFAGAAHSMPAVARGALLSEPFVALWLAAQSVPDPPTWPAYLQVAADVGVPVLLPIDRTTTSPARRYALARSQPTVACVLCAVPGGAAWTEAAEAVCASADRRDALLFICTAHAGAEEVRRILRIAPPDRVLFASGCDGSPPGISATATLLDSLRQTLAPTALRALLRENAASVVTRRN